MSLQEVQSEPKGAGSFTPFTPTLPITAPGPGAGEALSSRERPTPRPFYSHRLISLDTGSDWCVGCGTAPDPAKECLPTLPRCDSCGQHPAVLNDGGFKVCSSCMNGGRSW